MIYVLLAIGVVFIALAFILTENNAKYLLAGYNTLSTEEQKKVDVEGLIAHYKRFFIFLGISLVLIGLTVDYYLPENYAGLIVSIYIVVACIYLVITSRKFYKKD